MNYFIKAITRHLIIFTLISLGFVLFVFISSLSNEIHPDAYKDAVMSVVYVYGMFLIVYMPYQLIMHKTKFKDSRFAVALKAWYKQSTLFDHIAIWFTMITVINSMMMLTGIDAPKQGTFAYVHLLIRLGIVTLAVCLYRAKNIYKKLKEIKTWKLSISIKSIIENSIQHPFMASFKLFTVFTIVYCLIHIVFESVINPQGGAPLYILLLIIFSVLILLSIIQSIFKRKIA